MEKEIEESPYCEICGHCGEIGCCGIVNFLEEHIKDKTNCKNEGWIIQGIKDICEYETSVFKENKILNKGIDELIKKYEELYENSKMSLFENSYRYGNFLQDLKKLKGE